MALPVIDDVFRVTWNFQSYDGITPRIVQHYRTSTANGQDVGLALWDAVVDNLFLPMHESFEPTSLSLIRLDGTSATVVVPRPVDVTANLCAGDGQIIPASAAVMSWRSLVRGPKGRGRSYIGPVTEGANENGMLVGDSLTELPAAWGSFYVALGEQDPSIGPVVASYVHEEAYLIQGASLSEVLGTQRRRQNQLR